MQRHILHILWPRSAASVKHSEQISRVLADCAALSPLVEPYGAEEIFIDLTGVSKARQAIAHVCRATRIETLSPTEQPPFAVLAPNMFLARLGSHVAQSHYPQVPSFTRRETAHGPVIGELSPADVPAFLAPLPLRFLWPVPASIRTRLAHLGIAAFQDIALVPRPRLEAEFGPHMGIRLKQLAHGIHTAQVQALYPKRQLAVRYDFSPEHHINNNASAAAALKRLARELAAKLRDQGEACFVITLRCTSRQGQTGKAIHLKTPTQSAATIETVAQHLFARLHLDGPPQYITLTATHFTNPAVIQAELFAANYGQETSPLDPTGLMVGIQQRFGRHALQFAAALQQQRRDKVHALWGV